MRVLARRIQTRVAAAGAVGLAFAGGALAAGTAEPVRACYDNTTGALHVITRDNPCEPERETVLDWNLEGPAGATGAPGPRGQDAVVSADLLNGLPQAVALVPPPLRKKTPNLAAPPPKQVADSEAIARWRDGPVVLPAQGALDVIRVPLPKGRWVLSAKLNTGLAPGAPQTPSQADKVAMTWLGVSELEWKLMRGGAQCSLRAGADYDVGWSYIGEHTIALTVVHRYERTGLAALTCDGLYAQVRWAKVTALKVGKLSNASYP